MTRLHSTQTKKSYKKPVLVKKGNVAKLTKGVKPGSNDLESGGQV
ncbi:lasso RiPP family leader peptide-containing protein [Dyadobacter subterraneus]|uniref:Lasso RiPP family leader peptide-containing protein n=1 Tax=Dyadobacter subterraneus TaxID=2773304 RepID=A0ABR9WI66_9BACT|nr:lasso RiPP family leader peptide-containing protein [Dyadobacter subterraneus]MBE9465078.1 lasso RiPP family leader peptide-containing protein [Dyadobacter subterraneus]